MRSDFRKISSSRSGVDGIGFHAGELECNNPVIRKNNKGGCLNNEGYGESVLEQRLRK